MKIADIDQMKPQKLLLSQSHPFAIQHGKPSSESRLIFPISFDIFQLPSLRCRHFLKNGNWEMSNDIWKIILVLKHFQLATILPPVQY
jgi:hypothetical protein